MNDSYRTEPHVLLVGHSNLQAKSSTSSGLVRQEVRPTHPRSSSHGGYTGVGGVAFDLLPSQVTSENT